MGAVTCATERDSVATSPLSGLLSPLVTSLWLVACVVVWLGGAPAPPAAAHASLVSSDPAEAGLVEVLPSRAVLSFSGRIVEVHEVAVTGPGGDVVNGAATYDGAEVRQNLWAGPDGDYVMTYDVVAADGHEISGEVHFEVGALSAPAAAAAGGDSTGAAAGPWATRPGVLLPVGAVLVAAAAALGVARRRRAAGRP